MSARRPGELAAARPSRVWPLVALFWCLLLARFAQAFVWPEAWGLSDDIYISAGAARSLWEGFGPVWYAGAPRVEGFSNPLWVGVLALLHGVPGFTEDRLGALVFGVNLLLLCGLARACVRALAGAGVERGGVLLALSPAAAALTCFAAEGFEVVLVAWQAVLAHDAAWRREPRPIPPPVISSGDGFGDINDDHDCSMSLQRAMRLLRASITKQIIFFFFFS